MREKKTRSLIPSASPHRVEIIRTSLDQKDPVSTTTYIRGSGDRLWRPAG